METSKTSPPSWKVKLQKALLRQVEHHPPLRLAVVGIGNPLRGDDRAGPAVARALQASLTGREQFLVLDAGPAPENFTGVLRHFKPGLVLLVDAAEMGELPGAVRWLDWASTEGYTASSHTLPPSLLASYLEAELGCEVALLGIQPADTPSLSDSLSLPVREAVERTVEGILRGFEEVS